jgi:hypothetical protein
MTRLRRLLDLYRARWGRYELYLLVGYLVVGGALAAILSPACSPAAESRAKAAEGFAKAACAEWTAQSKAPADAGSE